MAIQKKNNKIKRKTKILTKRDKAHKRVTRVHKAIQKKRKERVQKKKIAANFRRKLATVDENQIVEMANPNQRTQNATDIQLNLLDILGIGQGQAHGDWENALQKKLRQVEQKSLDNPEVKRVYGQIGKLFSRYRSGKIPKAFKIIPNLEHWKQVIQMTRPDQWTSQAMVQAVNIFASNFDPVRAQEFYKTWLVPTIRRDLANNKKLNVHLYQALKKALYKTNAWFKGIMFQFCNEDTLLRETKVIESLLSKMSIPVITASVAMLKLMQVPYCNSAIHYLSALLNKHYTLPKRVLTRLTQYLISFKNFEGQLPIVWHSMILTLGKQYSQSLDQMAIQQMKVLVKQKNHKLISPQILKCLA